MLYFEPVPKDQDPDPVQTLRAIIISSALILVSNIGPWSLFGHYSQLAMNRKGQIVFEL